MGAVEESLSWHGCPGSPWQFMNDASQTCKEIPGAQAFSRGREHSVIALGGGAQVMKKIWEDGWDFSGGRAGEGFWQRKQMPGEELTLH